jgi:hypothetical protein
MAVAKAANDPAVFFEQALGAPAHGNTFSLTLLAVAQLVLQVVSKSTQGFMIAIRDNVMANLRTHTQLITEVGEGGGEANPDITIRACIIALAHECLGQIQGNRAVPRLQQSADSDPLRVASLRVAQPSNEFYSEAAGDVREGDFSPYEHDLKELEPMVIAISQVGVEGNYLN